MADLFEYLEWRGDLTLGCSPFNEVDAMIISRLSYLPFESIIEKNTALGASVAEACAKMRALPDIKSRLLLEDDAKLLFAMTESMRFGSMKIFGYINRVDDSTQTQFSAITVGLGDSRYYICFRGTDNTLTGWKEDFNMCFVYPVPAQKLALRYLSDMAARLDGRLIVGGHSKGGNLAVYASSFCSEEIRSRIDVIYNFDGPGFDDKVLHSAEFTSMAEKIKTFVPQSSVVGMLFGHEEDYIAVHSTRTNMLWQHDTYSWEVSKYGFIRLEDVDSGSRIIDYTLKEWLSKMSYAQREKFVDAIFEILSETNIKTFKEMGSNKLMSAKALLKSATNLEPSTRRAVIKALTLLAGSAKNGISHVMQKK